MANYDKLSKLKEIYKSRKRGLNLLFYNIIGNGFTLLLNFILPFFLSVHDYGYFALLFSIFNVVTAIFTFGIDSSMLKFALQKENNENVLQNGACTWVIYSIVAGIITLSLSYLFTDYIKVPVSLNALSVTVIAGIIISFQRTVLAYYLAQTSLKRYGLSFIENKGLQLLSFLLILFIVPRSSFYLYIPYIFLIQSSITITMVLWQNRKVLFLKRLNVYQTKKFIRFNFPLTFNTLGNVGYGYGFNIMMSSILPISQLGILNIFVQFGNIFSLSSNALSSGYLPTFYDSARENISKASKAFFKYLSINGVILFLSTYIFGSFYFGLKEFVLSKSFILQMLFIYLLGILFYTFKSIGSNWLLIENKTLKTTLFTFCSVVVSLFVGFVLAKEAGFLGSVIGIVVGYLFQTIVFNIDVLKKLFD